jgi:hypothetical protein
MGFVDYDVNVGTFVWKHAKFYPVEENYFHNDNDSKLCLFPISD